jgi:heat shock protein HspQ
MSAPRKPRLWRRGVRDLGGAPKLSHITGAARVPLSGPCPQPTLQRSTMEHRNARYAIGQVVQHRVFPFRGVIFDVDPEFSNTEEWYQSIPEEVRPSKDQPFYHLLAENAESFYVAYVSEQNLVPDPTGGPVGHPSIGQLFGDLKNGRYAPGSRYTN